MSGYHLCLDLGEKRCIFGNVQQTEYFFIQMVWGVFEDFGNNLRTAVNVVKCNGNTWEAQTGDKLLPPICSVIQKVDEWSRAETISGLIEKSINRKLIGKYMYFDN